MTRSRPALLDILDEAAASIARRPSRSALTMLGTLLGVATFVATISMGATTAAEVGARFDLLEATAVSVIDAAPGSEGPPFPEELQPRLGMLNGVVHGGQRWTLQTQFGVWVAPAAGPARPIAIPVVAASRGYIEATQPRLTSGTVFDDLDLPRVLLGSAAALRLGNPQVGGSVSIDGIPMTVSGILEDVARSPDLLLGVIIPLELARRVWGTPALSGAEVLLDVELGAAEQVASEAAAAIRPDDPNRLLVRTPTSPEKLRAGIENDLDVFLLAIAGITMLIGGIGIANTALVSVLERVSEIGLRRAVGASRSAIASQFLGESIVLGFLGGTAGAAVGTLTTVAIASLRQVTPVVEPLAALAAPVLGAVVGLCAGLYPAIKAANLEPLEALRR